MISNYTQRGWKHLMSPDILRADARNQNLRNRWGIKTFLKNVIHLQEGYQVLFFAAGLIIGLQYRIII
jgi:hypothetical protein